MSSQLSTVASQGQRTGSRRRNTLFWVGAEWIYRAFSFLSALDQPLFTSATPCQDGSDSVEPAGFCSGPDPSYRDHTEEESVQGTEAMCLTPYKKKSWRHLEPRPGLFLLCLACGPEPPPPQVIGSCPGILRLGTEGSCILLLVRNGIPPSELTSLGPWEQH